MGTPKLDQSNYLALLMTAHFIHKKLYGDCNCQSCFEAKLELLFKENRLFWDLLRSRSAKGFR